MRRRAGFKATQFTLQLPLILALLRSENGSPEGNARVKALLAAFRYAPRWRRISRGQIRLSASLKRDYSAIGEGFRRAADSDRKSRVGLLKPLSCGLGRLSEAFACRPTVSLALPGSTTRK